MQLSGQAYPGTNETMGSNMPVVYNPGLSKEEFLFIQAVAGALASGARASQAIAIANAVLEAYDKPTEEPHVEPETKTPSDTFHKKNRY